MRDEYILLRYFTFHVCVSTAKNKFWNKQIVGSDHLR